MKRTDDRPVEPGTLDAADRRLVELLREHGAPRALAPARRDELRRAVVEGTPARRPSSWTWPAASFAGAFAAALLALLVLRSPEPSAPPATRVATADDASSWGATVLMPVDPVGAVEVEALDELPGEYRILASYLEP